MLVCCFRLCLGADLSQRGYDNMLLFNSLSYVPVYIYICIIYIYKWTEADFGCHAYHGTVPNAWAESKRTQGARHRPQPGHRWSVDFVEANLDLPHVQRRGRNFRHKFETVFLYFCDELYNTSLYSQFSTFFKMVVTQKVSEGYGIQRSVLSFLQAALGIFHKQSL